MSATATIDGATGETCGERRSRPTLDRVIAGAWIRLGEHDPAQCPVCMAPMAPVYGAHARPVGGRCTECGSELR